MRVHPYKYRKILGHGMLLKLMKVCGGQMVSRQHQLAKHDSGPRSAAVRLGILHSRNSQQNSSRAVAYTVTGSAGTPVRVDSSLHSTRNSSQGKPDFHTLPLVCLVFILESGNITVLCSCRLLMLSCFCWLCSALLCSCRLLMLSCLLAVLCSALLVPASDAVVFVGCALLVHHLPP